MPRRIIVDGRVIGVGSMNLDRRSRLQNTRVTLVIHSQPLSRQTVGQAPDQLSWAMHCETPGRLKSCNGDTTTGSSLPGLSTLRRTY